MYQILRKRRDFQQVTYSGQKQYSKHYIIIQKNNALGYKRLGITASKKIGCAVKRNRAKRIIREIFRLNYNQFPESTDILFIAKQRSHDLKMQDAAREILGCLMSNRSKAQAYYLGS